MPLKTVFVGNRPLTKDRCPRCREIDADARVVRVVLVRESPDAQEPEALAYEILLRCRKDGAAWRVKWTVGPQERLPGQFHATDQQVK